MRKWFTSNRVWMTREIETWLVRSVAIVWLTTEANDQSSPLLRDFVDSCHVWPYWASRCKLWRWMFKGISIHRPIWTGFDGLKHIVSCRSTNCETPHRCRHIVNDFNSCRILSVLYHGLGDAPQITPSSGRIRILALYVGPLRAQSSP